MSLNSYRKRKQKPNNKESVPTVTDNIGWLATKDFFIPLAESWASPGVDYRVASAIHIHEAVGLYEEKQNKNN